ncbi:oxidoreductase [Brevirhabdus pacifica]|uniref:Oxidoreductase n=1 Tax=Brevirhabdus pacifica TaxID=1267768 RepID=A0A1U7DHL0_9RHOB|nr:NAD(P)-dependent oxidoreductase [Brevirhabdus pacifica]APX89466.1 oxidoreductase [Brevirhabdus pacifica]OWU76524.1 hypothetical protein ATO5_09460 [Loktanella sp. 22II-4b]PJJ85886.1 3-hydroxyisobutyrate dehydrogenase/2-hydroxy-3-oxopropionate reductase [Brevirhabdus pacifica]
MRCGFIGVGEMGRHMAGHVQNAGHEVRVHDLDAAALKACRAEGLAPAAGLAELATWAEALVIMVATDDQTRAVVADILGALGGSDSAQPPAILVTATNHPDTMRELAAACAEAGVDFVDAPVCYGREGARNGDLVSLAGGPARAVARLSPVMLSYSRSIEHIGEAPGSGQIAKTCNNMMHWAACVANYEVLSLARSLGLDAQRMRETLLKCPARNTTLERWDTTRFTWHEKDMDLALELAQSRGLPLPLFGAVDQLVKHLGPQDVADLLRGERAAYLGKPLDP